MRVFVNIVVLARLLRHTSRGILLQLKEFEDFATSEDVEKVFDLSSIFHTNGTAAVLSILKSLSINN